MVRWCWVNFQCRCVNFQCGGVLQIYGWSGGAIVLGKLPVSGRPTLWMIVGQGPTALAVGAGGGCLGLFILVYLFSSLSPPLWETARYRLKYCLKGPLNPKQLINQPTLLLIWIIVGQEPTAFCSNCGRWLFGHFFSRLSSLFLLPLSGRRPDID